MESEKGGGEIAKDFVLATGLFCTALGVKHGGRSFLVKIVIWLSGTSEKRRIARLGGCRATDSCFV